MAQAALDEDLHNTFSKALHLYLKDRLKSDELSETEKKETQELIEKTKISTSRHRAQINDELTKLWDNYTAPTKTVNMAREEYEKYKLSCMQKNIEARKKKPDGSDSGLQVPVPDFIDCVAASGPPHATVYKRIKPETGDIESEPLEFTGKITLELFDDEIVLSPVSGKVNVTETLAKVLVKAQGMGLTRDHLAIWMKLFVHQHMPERHADISYVQNTREVFLTLISSISYAGHATKIKKEMRKLTREPGVDISIPIDRYKSLVKEYIAVLQPYKSRTVVAEEAERAANKLIKNFVTPVMWAEVERYREKYMKRYTRYASVQEQLEFIAEKEDSEEHIYGLKENLILKTDCADVRIYNTRILDTYGSHETGVYMNTSGGSQATLAATGWGGTGGSPAPSAPPYRPKSPSPAPYQTRSTGPATGPPLHRAHEFGVNRSLELNKTNYGSDQYNRNPGIPPGTHTSRKDQFSLPQKNAARKFIQSPGGTLRPYSRSPSSNYDNRNRTSSPWRSQNYRPRSGQSPKRNNSGSRANSPKPGQSPRKLCMLCFREHAPPPSPCFIYGRNVIEKVMCPCGKGYHDPKQCRTEKQNKTDAPNQGSPGSSGSKTFNPNLR